MVVCLVREVSVPTDVDGWSTGCHAYALLKALPVVPTGAPVPTAAPTPAPVVPTEPTSPTAPPTPETPTAAPVVPIEPTSPTAPPTTETPTAPPTTETPTAPPTTEAPTATPTTLAPTETPTTLAPTAPPTTMAPTAPPTTLAPTAPPTTMAPTAPPTTLAPTATPTTLAPTAPPTTLTPTAPPTTVAPTAPVAPTTAKRSVEFIIVSADQFNVTKLLVESGTGIDAVYTLAVAYAEQDKEMNYTSQVVQVSLVGKYCLANEVPVDDKCESVAELALDTTKLVLALQAGQTIYASLNATADKLIGRVAIELTADKDDVLVTGAYAAVPSFPGFERTDESQIINIDNPAVGLWVIALRNNGSKLLNATVSINATKCDEGKFGPECATKLSGNTTNVSPGAVVTEGGIVLKKEEVQYIRYVVDQAKNMTLTFSVAEHPNADGNPKFAARRGQLPTVYPIDSKSNDVVGCNNEGCEKGVPGFYDASAPDGVWYIAVKNTGTDDIRYDIWFNSICGKDCSGEGTCNESGPKQGVCECTSKYEGIMCDKEKPIPFEYIVLIIIASLVVLSAIIGFIAWAYMRRKRIKYERVE